MKKKILIIILVILLLSVISIIFISNSKEKIKVNLKNISAITESFTITDSATEIEVKLKNDNLKEIKIQKVEAALYDTSNKKITTLEYTKALKLETKKEKIVQIKSNEKYPNTANIKYKIVI